MSDSGNGDISCVVELVQGLVNIDTDIAHLAHIAALSTHRIYGYVFSSTVKDAGRIKTTELGSPSAWTWARGADSDSSTSTFGELMCKAGNMHWPMMAETRARTERDKALRRVQELEKVIENGKGG